MAKKVEVLGGKNIERPPVKVMTAHKTQGEVTVKTKGDNTGMRGRPHES